MCQKQQFEGVIVRGKCGKTTQSWGKSDTKRIQNEGILKHVLRAKRKVKPQDVKSRHNRRIISLSPLTNRHL